MDNDFGAGLDADPAADVTTLNLGPAMSKFTMEERPEGVPHPRGALEFDMCDPTTYGELNHYASVMNERGFNIEFEVYNSGQFWVLQDLIDNGHVKTPFMVQFVLGVGIRIQPRLIGRHDAPGHFGIQRGLVLVIGFFTTLLAHVIEPADRGSGGLGPSMTLFDGARVILGQFDAAQQQRKRTRKARSQKQGPKASDVIRQHRQFGQHIVALFVCIDLVLDRIRLFFFVVYHCRVFHSRKAHRSQRNRVVICDRQTGVSGKLIDVCHQPAWNFLDKQQLPSRGINQLFQSASR